MVGGKLKMLRDMRSGSPAHKNVTIGSGDATITVAVVALNADEMQRIDEMVEEYAQANQKKVNDSVRGQYYNKLLATYCMRDPDDPKLMTPVCDDPDEVGMSMDLEDISRVMNAYGELMINKAPKLETLTEAQYTEIKNFLEVTPLSGISTVLRVHLASCHQTIVSEK